MTDPLHWSDRLSEYLDGDLSPVDRTACAAHLETCASCRDTLGELVEVRHRVAGLPGIPPATDLWPGIAERLGASPGAFARRGLSRQIVVSLRSLAAAAVLVAVASGSLVWFALRPASPGIGSPVDTTSASVLAVALDASVDPIIADLERLLRERTPSLDPAILRAVATDLRAIDQSLSNIRSALARDPANGELNRQLARLLRAKVDRLREAALQPAERGAA